MDGIGLKTKIVPFRGVSSGMYCRYFNNLTLGTSAIDIVTNEELSRIRTCVAIAGDVSKTRGITTPAILVLYTRVA